MFNSNTDKWSFTHNLKGYINFRHLVMHVRQQDIFYDVSFRAKNRMGETDGPVPRTIPVPIRQEVNGGISLLRVEPMYAL